ncbi:pantoate--beta-alanine ligase [Corynebacterium diphtheriae]|nr:pantoate--beta-alanine ligase [Corynebacterium diphtheriae]
MFHVKHDIIAAAINAMAGMDIDYIDVVAPDFSEPTAGNELYGDARIITAVKVGSTRLLDNMAVNVEKPNA